MHPKYFPHAFLSYQGVLDLPTFRQHVAQGYFRRCFQLHNQQQADVVEKLARGDRKISWHSVGDRMRHKYCPIRDGLYKLVCFLIMPPEMCGLNGATRMRYAGLWPGLSDCVPRSLCGSGRNVCCCTRLKDIQSEPHFRDRGCDNMFDTSLRQFD